ncbi:MAG: AraC family transcriptional regulator [Candidatus Brocadiaceae bacterium]|jgi:AraC-like DNA-binding protein
MASEEVVAHAWPRPEGLQATTVWAATVGELTGYGTSLRSAVLDAVYPHLVTRGRGTFTSRNGTHEVGPGDMFCVWPGIQHEFYERADDPWHFYWMRLDGEGAEALARSLGFSETRQVTRPGEPERAILLCRRLFECYARRDRRDPYRPLSLLFQLVSACRRPGQEGDRSSPGRRLVEEARVLLVSLLDTGINVSGLAERLHVSRQTLLAAFREELDVAPIDYIQSMRLERAKRLLVTTHLKISAVAHASGYGHEKYFYRRFRELTGRTPGAWRSAHRGAGGQSRAGASGHASP